MDQDVQILLRERHCAAAFELLLDRYREKVFRLVYFDTAGRVLPEDPTHRRL